MTASATRIARRDLRRAGCTCHPTVTILPTPAIRAAGATSGAYIKHELGCRLGDAVAVANTLGFVPAMTTHERRCSR